MRQDQFVCLSSDVWVVNRRFISGARRIRLLHPPEFTQIVSRLVKSALPSKTYTEPRLNLALSGDAQRRAIVRFDLSADREAFDLFFNSAAGVRAQCVHRVNVGEAALDHIRDKLRAKALDAATAWRSSRMASVDVRTSLESPNAKVWVQQGLWVRRAKSEARHLLVAQWHAHVAREGKHERDLVRYGSKAPQSPAVIEYIGSWIRNGMPVEGKSSALRSLEIHCYGFT